MHGCHLAKKIEKYDRMSSMKTMNLKCFLCLWVLLITGFLQANGRRNIPLDMYLIIDASAGTREARDEIVEWINTDVIERLLQEGDRLIIWSAGDTARIIHSETIGSQKNEAKQKVQNLEIQGRSADFSSAMREAASRIAQSANEGIRISYTLIVSSSAGTLAPALEGNASWLFRWSRVVKYSGWQALVVAPGIGEKVHQAATAFMSSR